MVGVLDTVATLILLLYGGSVMRLLEPKLDETYGRLTITAILGRFPLTTLSSGGNPIMRWRVVCTCTCGREAEVEYNHLRSGGISSCGCLKRENTRAANTAHGACSLDASDIDRKLWYIWRGMLQRCKRDIDYLDVPIYGPWRKSFASFQGWAKKAGYREGESLSIDRIDGTKGYSPVNCRWATATQQARNRRTNRLITWLEETKCAAEWFEDPRCPVTKNTYYSRVQKGWSPVEAISTPVMRRVSVKQRG